MHCMVWVSITAAVSIPRMLYLSYRQDNIHLWIIGHHACAPEAFWHVY